LLWGVGDWCQRLIWQAVNVRVTALFAAYHPNGLVWSVVAKAGERYEDGRGTVLSRGGSYALDIGGEGSAALEEGWRRNGFPSDRLKLPVAQACEVRIRRRRCTGTAWAVSPLDGGLVSDLRRRRATASLAPTGSWIEESYDRRRVPGKGGDISEREGPCLRRRGGWNAQRRRRRSLAGFLQADRNAMRPASRCCAAR
jgi:hypothetical protein